MKKMILFLLCLSELCFLVAQEDDNYIPLFNKEGNQMWVWEVYYPVDNGVREVLYNKAKLLENSDTIIDGKTYKKIEYYAYYITHNYREVKIDSVIYVREENKKIYMLINEEISKGEELLCDFSLSVGDTFRLRYNEDFRYQLLSGCNFSRRSLPLGIYNSNLLTVTAIDTVNIGGIDRRRWHIENTKSTTTIHTIDKWIEGIGSENGLFYNACVTNYWETPLYICTNFRCYEYNEELMIHNTGVYTEEWDCNIPYNFMESLEEDEPDISVFVYPNPTKNILNINSNKELDKLELYNTFGQKIYSNIGECTSIQINTSSLQSGIYFIKIYMGDNIFNKKIIIE
ncbi:MAG: T9SS type A sorting domain-containing protein [Bacteroidales bacterium]|nr:T9SS type A sorting domain-containing protein [Bacteroidales bacterium]